MRFTDKIALITGSSRGIGRAVALRLAAEGARVVVNYRRNAEQAEAVVAEVRRLGSSAVAVQADMSNGDDVRALFRRVQDHFGYLDILVANAAATSFRPLLRQGEHNVTRTFDLTVKGFVLAVQQAVPLMQGRRGKIVTISGIDSLRALSGHGLLGAAKAALENLTMYLAHELGPQGIAVNGVNPGLIETDSSKMYSGGEEGYAQYVRDVLPQTPAGRVGRPEDVAAVTAFLCSEDADFIRGQTLLVDGGLLSSSVASRPHE
ncbi:MAG TPA: glucose 1-dehydrogenase [Candidatus Binatia bacterium]|nr:glucose 1-dehydrogenase [Candidatus Binatia bacterium]